MGGPSGSGFYFQSGSIDALIEEEREGEREIEMFRCFRSSPHRPSSPPTSFLAENSLLFVEECYATKWMGREGLFSFPVSLSLSLALKGSQAPGFASFPCSLRSGSGGGSRYISISLPGDERPLETAFRQFGSALPVLVPLPSPPPVRRRGDGKGWDDPIPCPPSTKPIPPSPALVPPQSAEGHGTDCPWKDMLAKRGCLQLFLLPSTMYSAPLPARPPAMCSSVPRVKTIGGPYVLVYTGKICPPPSGTAGSSLRRWANTTPLTHTHTHARTHARPPNLPQTLLVIM